MANFLHQLNSTECPKCHKLAFHVVTFKGGTKKYIHEIKTLKQIGSSHSRTATISCIVRKFPTIKKREE